MYLGVWRTASNNMHCTYVYSYGAHKHCETAIMYTRTCTSAQNVYHMTPTAGDFMPPGGSKDPWAGGNDHVFFWEAKKLDWEIGCTVRLGQPSPCPCPCKSMSMCTQVHVHVHASPFPCMPNNKITKYCLQFDFACCRIKGVTFCNKGVEFWSFSIIFDQKMILSYPWVTPLMFFHVQR